MWLLLAMMGAVAASAMVETGLGSPRTDDEPTGGPTGPTGPADEDPDETEGAGEMIDYADDAPEPEPAPEEATAAAQTDPWLEGEDKEYVSTDAPSDEPQRPPDGLPFEFVDLNEPGAERDPWLDGWREDEYVSTDEPPTAPPVKPAGLGRATV